MLWPMAPPRDLPTRVADTRHRLATDRDCWLATAGADGAWLVPLTFLWHDERVVMATSSRARVVADIAEHPGVRIALDNTRDVVMITGQARIKPIGDCDEGLLAAFRDTLGSDPGDWAGVVIVVTPDRIQAWREENELEGRELMTGGRWLDADG